LKYSRGNLLLTVFIILLGLISIATAAYGESNPSVLMFDVEGNHKIPAEKILGVISATRIGEPLNTQAVQTDLQSIWDLGYFADVQVKSEKFLNGVKLIFVVIENPLFKEIRISGLVKAKPEEVRAQFSQKTGEVFNTATFRKDLDKAKRYFRDEKGLFIELVKTGLTKDGIVNLELVELKVGKISVVGLEKTQENVVRREISVKEGEILDWNVFKDEMYKIWRLRLFETIEPKLEASATPNALDIIIEVKEAATGSFQIGASYSENTHEMGGMLIFTEDNLMGLGQSVSLDLNISESGKNVSFNYYDPWLDDKHTSFGLSLWNSDSETRSTMNSWKMDPSQLYTMDLTRTGLSLSFGRPFFKDSRASLKFNFEKNIIDDFYLDSDSDKKNPLGVPPESDHSKEFWDNSVGIELVKNKLQGSGRSFVTGGYQLFGSYSVAGKYLGGEFDYQKSVLEGKWFHSLTPNLVVGTRMQWANLTGDYPDYDQLYLGGMNKLRGYDDRRFHDSFTRDLIGSSYLLSNTELRYRLPAHKALEFVAFYDAGQLTDSGSKTIKYDYGVGLRYDIPMLGMLRVDQAWNADNDSKIVISMGEIF
jgi:outer membrane protein insertion porin family